MSTTVNIRGVGPVGGFGAGRNNLWNALRDPPGPNGSVEVRTPTGEKSLPVYRASTAPLLNYVSKRKLRRLERFSRLAVLGAYLALEDAMLLEDMDGDEVGIVLASGYGPTEETLRFLDQINREDDAYASPTLFSNSARSVAQSMISLMLGITGPALTVSEFQTSVPMALVNAVQWLREGRVRYVLLGGVDEHCAARSYCHERLYEGCPGKSMQALKHDHNTPVLGEGAAFVLLSREEAKGGSYGQLRDVHMGQVEDTGCHHDVKTPLLVDADGRSVCGEKHRTNLPVDVPVTSCRGVYGRLPVGPAFAMAVAALACGKGVLPLVHTDSQSCQEASGSADDLEVTSAGIRCLTHDSEGNYGCFTVTPPGYKDRGEVACNLVQGVIERQNDTDWVSGRADSPPFTLLSLPPPHRTTHGNEPLRLTPCSYRI